MTRRELLKRAAGAGVTVAIGSLSGCTHLAQPPRDFIRRENSKKGTTDWLLTNTRVDPKAQYRCPWIEGYCSRTSVRACSSVEPEARSSIRGFADTGNSGTFLSRKAST